MAIKVLVNVDNPGDILTGYGVGSLLRLERDTTSAFGAPAEIDTEAILATQSQYEFWDGTGTAAHWYRSRISNSAGNQFSSYSDPFQAGAPQAYASIDSLREMLQLPPGADRDNLLADVLVRVSDKIDVSLGFDFYRHPAVSGTEVRTFDGEGSGRIYFQTGFNSVTQVRHATSTGTSYTTMAAGDWKLRMPVGPSEAGPFLMLRLADTAGAPTGWYTGFDTVEVTGVFGYTSIPPAIEQATLHWAADLYRIGAFGGVAGVGVGIEEFGQPRFLGGAPRIAYETIEDYRRRHAMALVA